MMGWLEKLSVGKLYYGKFLHADVNGLRKETIEVVFKVLEKEKLSANCYVLASTCKEIVDKESTFSCPNPVLNDWEIKGIVKKDLPLYIWMPHISDEFRKMLTG
jgi:hypothetical protein